MSKRNEEITVRMTPELRAEVERAAAEERRSLGAVIRCALLDWACERVQHRDRASAA